MGKILHRCDANCDVDMAERTFTARRDIATGEWVTMIYAQTEDRLCRPFVCVCGATPCDGYAAGRPIQARAVGKTPNGRALDMDKRQPD